MKATVETRVCAPFKGPLAGAPPRTRWARLIPLTALLIVSLASPASAQGGTLDASFGGDGKLTTNFTSGSDVALGVGVDPAGRIVVAGQVAQAGGAFALARYDADGALDNSFSTDGKVTTNFTSGSDAAYDMAVQSADGKVVAVGRSGGGGGRFALARYNTDGTLDQTFGGDGKVTTNFTPGDDFAFGVAIQPTDEKIVTAGRVEGSGGRIALVRYNSDGTLDTTFSGDGKVATNLTSGDDRADLVTIQPADGKIVAAGTANYFRASARFALVRYNSNGSLDATFSGDGKVTTNFTSGFDGAFGVAIQPVDGKVVAAGQAGERMGLARYNTDGTLDDTFSADGKVTTNFTPRLDYADDVAVQDDGKIVAVGASNFFGPDSRFALARYNTDGSLDDTFSGDGKVTTNFTSGFDGAFGVAIQPADGKIVVAGRAAGSGGRFAVARFLAN